MKALKKGKEYTRVAPLPDEWLGEKEIARKAESKDVYQEGFKKLKVLLDSGWEFCPREPMRKFERKQIAACEPRGKTGALGARGRKRTKGKNGKRGKKKKE